ncbi:hypothetical protein [Rubinisphaera italica]|uniref:Uncharacterized protein n=1 Tax=Rubinisphaera italica TaxID=2527969 RepID=A0A5C5XM81_9PLAN|nr:hypothetical protein [Rubinisphaera italica]TWT62842.1 hypothetical protein Pan54_35880 [Rubinisphaera italica]
MSVQTKAAVTVAEMSRMLGMSRARFYQLLGSTFPEPSRDERGRPFYNESQQELCLEVRRRNCGVDGKPILFYAPRTSFTPSPTRSKPKPKVSEDYSAIIEGVSALGMSVTSTHVEEEIRKLFPDGISGLDEGAVIREVFLSINRQESK